MNRIHAKSRAVLACAVLMMIALPSAGLAAGTTTRAPGAIATTGSASISGSVTGPGAVPIEGIWANVYRWDSGGSVWVYLTTGTIKTSATATSLVEKTH